MSSRLSLCTASLGIGLVLLFPSAARSHALLHEVADGEAVVVRLSFSGHDRPLFEPYEVFAPGSATPFQAGRVNALGEVVFRPNEPGAWRLRVFTEDGHGADITLEIDGAGAVTTSGGSQGHRHAYWPRVLAALGYLLGIFGLLALWRQRRTRVGPA